MKGHMDQTSRAAKPLQSSRIFFFLFTQTTNGEQLNAAQCKALVTGLKAVV